MFRFTIRDMLWLTVLVAVATGWVIDRGRLAEQLRKVQSVRLENWGRGYMEKPKPPPSYRGIVKPTLIVE